MNSVSRYYLSASEWGSDLLVLQGEEAHHCVRVLRTQVGDTVEVFDGEGRSVQGKVLSATKSAVEIRPVSEPAMQERGVQIALCQAVPKAGNMELIVQKAVELGVASIQPLITENTVARAEQVSKKREKWQRIALEACKQCGQNWLPEVAEPLKLTQWLPARGTSRLGVVAALDTRSRPFHEVLSGVDQSVDLLVGPEGDFSENEYDSVIRAGFQPVTLGNIVLRVETATLFCLSVIRYELGR